MQLNQDGLSPRDIAQVICEMNPRIKEPDPTLGFNKNDKADSKSSLAKHVIDRIQYHREQDQIESGEYQSQGDLFAEDWLVLDD